MNDETNEQLRLLCRQYFQLVDLESLRWPDTQVLKRPEVQAWLYGHLFDRDAVPSPPSERYQLRVLKQLISRIESAIEDPQEDEISDDLMSQLSILLSSNLPSEALSAQQKTYVTYTFPGAHTGSDFTDNGVTLLESRSVISSSGTTGLRTWEAALHLGKYLSSTADGRRLIEDAHVIELGAGTGLISILCAKHLGARQTLATDGDEAVVDAIRSNVFVNGLESGRTIDSAALKWGWPIDHTSFKEDHGLGDLDVVLGADVTYDKSVIPALVSTIRQLFLLEPNLQILISATIRNEQTFEAFTKTCARNRFRIEHIDFVPVPESSQTGPFYPTSTPIKILRILQAEEFHDPFRI